MTFTPLPSSAQSGDLDNIAVTRGEFRAEIGLLLEFLAQALGDVTGNYTTEAVAPNSVVLQGTPTIEAGANPGSSDRTQRLPSTKWVKENCASVSDAAPTAPVDGMLWVDTSSSPYQFAAFNSGNSDWDVLSGFPSGTRMLFQQETAPTGWVKETGNDNMALRLVAGAPSVVDSNQPFTTAFSTRSISGTVGSTSLSVAQMPSHSHGISDPGHNHGVNFSDPGHSHNMFFGVRGDSSRGGGGNNEIIGGNNRTSNQGTGISVSINGNGTGVSVQNNGSGSSHTHSFSGTSINMNVNYMDVIVAEKS